MLSGRRLREKQELFATLHKVMAAMKAMAFAEMNRLQQQLGPETQCLQRYQQAMLALQEGRRLPTGSDAARKTVKNTEVVIGTERGFCGEINRRLSEHIQQQKAKTAERDYFIVGDRLQQLLDDGSFTGVTGAQSAEGIETVIDDLFARWLAQNQLPSLSSLQITYWDDMRHEITTLTALSQILPSNESTAADDFAPVCYTSKQELLRDLEPDLMFVLLHYATKMALLSENRQRMAHLDAATRHLKDKNEALQLQANQLRQSGIISEVEALLSVQDGLA